MKTLEVKTRAAWRAWLAKNHDKVDEIWLVYYKKHTGKKSPEYGATVEEALCYGWVDSLIKKLDDDRYARKFTPRKENSRWSSSNKKRVQRMTKEGLMTKHGQKKVDAGKKSGNWDSPAGPPELTLKMPPELAKALGKNKKAAKTFRELAPTYQKHYLAWIEVAKRPETKERRVKESIRLLAQGEKLGLR